jgi:signal transduction histidine kinase
MQEGKTIGMLGLGNREGGYKLEHQQAVEAIAPAIVQTLLRKRAEAHVTADLAGLTRMHALSGRLLETGGIQSLLQEIMDAAVSIVGAEKGTLQLLEGDSLRIVAAYGHQRSFIEFFASAENTASVCGEATRCGERVVVSDVETSSLFIGTPSLAVLREAGVRAVQSTPMMSRNGALLGILTTQWGVPYTPNEHDLWRIDLLARQAADLIEHSKSEDALLKSRDELELRVLERTVELKSYMAKLEQSNQALQDFAHIAAHDMKEPLRKVISFGNMLRQKSGDSLGQSGNDYLNRMLHATERMQSLLAGLLDYSKVATTSEPFKEIDLSDLISEVLSDLEVRIVKTGGKVQVGTLPVISADPTQMRRLFQNLIGNALKFHKDSERPVVKVSSGADNGYLQIIVEDNGIGFEEQYLEKIFAPFQRLHGKSSQYEGTGMGLAICKKIVERHGGSITATSAPGAGTRFIVRFPLRQST